MRCICSHCGKSMESRELCFDFHKPLTKGLSLRLNELENGESYAMAMETLTNRWEGVRSPVRLTEDDLIKWAPKRIQKANGSWEGELTVTYADWLSYLRKWRKYYMEGRWNSPEKPEFEKLSEDAEKLVEGLLDKSLSISGDILKEKVVYFLDGPFQKEPDPIRISQIKLLNSGPRLNRRYCPYCGEALSYWSGRFPETVLTVIGGPRASKSSALAACADFFTAPGALDRYGISWQGDNSDKDWLNFKKKSLMPYQNNRQTGVTNISSIEPIPRFSVLVHLRKGLNQESNLILTVVDLPGEFDQSKDEEEATGISENIFEEYLELYRRVDCVWYCTDDVEVSQLEILEKANSQNGTDQPDESVINAMARYGYDKGRTLIQTYDRVLKFAQYAALFRENVPVVFLMGKSDCLVSESARKGENPSKKEQNLYRPDYRPGDESSNFWVEIVRSQTPNLKGIGLYDKAKELREYLKNKNADLVTGFEEAFPAHTYIATSNYGHGFNQNQMNDFKKPFQTELPFLWMLAVLGHLKVVEVRKGILGGTVREIDRADAEKQNVVWRNLCMFGNAKDYYLQTE